MAIQILNKDKIQDNIKDLYHDRPPKRVFFGCKDCDIVWIATHESFSIKDKFKKGVLYKKLSCLCPFCKRKINIKWQPHNKISLDNKLWIEVPEVADFAFCWTNHYG